MKSLQSIFITLGAQEPLRYLKSAFWLSASKAASMVVSLATAFYIARSLGPQNFGELTYAQSIVGILALFGALISTLYRDLVKQPGREAELLGTAWLISFGASFLTATLAIIYILATPHDQLTVWVVSLLCIAQFFSPFSVIQNVFYANANTKWLSVTNFGTHLTISLLKIIAMASGSGVLVLAAIMVLEQVLNASIYSFLYLAVYKKTVLSWKIDRDYASKLVADSLPYVLVSGSMAIAARVDQIFIKNILDITTVGLYGMAVHLSEVWQFVPGIILTAFFPAIINAKSNPLSYRRRLSSLIGVFLLYGIGIAFVVSAFAPTVVGFIFGEEFLAGVSILQIYVWSLPGAVVGFVMIYFLVNENLRRIQIYTAVLPMLVNVLLNIAFIPTYGAEGAAWATVISYTLLPALPFFFKSSRDAFLAISTETPKC